MKLFTNKNFFDGYLQPLQIEHNALPLKIRGHLPENINGVYYRNGPNARFKPMGFQHFVDGDGMIHAFHFHEGSVFYTNKWVKTTCFDLEANVERSLFSTFLYPTLSDKSVRRLAPEKRSKANTHIIFQGKKLLAFEESALPFELDIKTLSTQSQLQYDHPKVIAISGHPKIDPITQEMHSINWHGVATLPKCSYTIFTKTGGLKKYYEIEAPYRSIIHDIAMTENYIIIPIFPLIIDVEKTIANPTSSLLHWNPDLNSYLGVLPKNNPNKIAWHPINLAYMLHSCNAYEENQMLYLDLIAHDAPPIFCEMNNKVPSCSYSQLQRCVINLRTGQISIKKLDDIEYAYNFPRVANERLGLKHEQIYFCGSLLNSNSNLLIDSDMLIAYDFVNNSKKIYQHGKNYVVGEPILMTTKEQNYIGSLWYDKQNDKSEFLIHLENEIDQEPLVIIDIPHRIPYGFHGNWYSHDNNNFKN